MEWITLKKTGKNKSYVTNIFQKKELMLKIFKLPRKTINLQWGEWKKQIKNCKIREIKYKKKKIINFQFGKYKN